MIFKYKNSNNIHGTFELDEDGRVIDYELYVPDNVPLLPVELKLTNLDTILVKLHGINRMKAEKIYNTDITVDNNTKTKYELMKILFPKQDV